MHIRLAPSGPGNTSASVIRLKIGEEEIERQHVNKLCFCQGQRSAFARLFSLRFDHALTQAEALTFGSNSLSVL